MQYYGPRASLLYLCPSPGIMWSAAAWVWSHWPQEETLSLPIWAFRWRYASLKWLSSHQTLTLPATAIQTAVLKRSLYESNILTGGKAGVKFQNCFPAGFCGSLDCLNPLSFLLRVHSSPTAQLDSERIRWGVHSRGIRQSAYNSPPWLWINQHWCKTIKPMRYGYLFILIRQSSALWITQSKCIIWRGFRTQTAPEISISLYVCYVWVQRRFSSPLKQPLDRYPIRLGPFSPSRILFLSPHNLRPSKRKWKSLMENMKK